MSIRLLAIELYRAQQKVDVLEKQIESDSNKQNQDKLNELREARKEYLMIKKMFESRKKAASSDSILKTYYRGMK